MNTLNKVYNNIEWLQLYKSFGWNVIFGEIKSKAPRYSWSKFKTEKATYQEQFQQINDREQFNTYLITGETSENTVVLDIDKPEIFDRLTSFFSAELQDKFKVRYNTGTDNRFHCVFKMNTDLKFLDDYYHTKGMLDSGDSAYTLLYRHSTPIPYSIHPSGNLYKWNPISEIPVLNEKGNS